MFLAGLDWRSKLLSAFLLRFAEFVVAKRRFWRSILNFALVLGEIKLRHGFVKDLLLLFKLGLHRCLWSDLLLFFVLLPWLYLVGSLLQFELVNDLLLHQNIQNLVNRKELFVIFLYIWIGLKHNLDLLGQKFSRLIHCCKCIINLCKLINQI